MMKWVFPNLQGYVFAVVAAAAVFCGCSKKASGPVAVTESVLARVGETVITAEDFERHLQSRQAHSPVPVDAEALLQELVDREVLAQNARKSGLQDDAEVREMMRDVLIAKFKERQLNPQLEAAVVTDEELKAAYEREKAQFTTPERVRLAMLYLPVPTGADGEGGVNELEVRRRLQMALDTSKKTSAAADAGLNQGFGVIAVNYSEDQESRYRGGEIGWVERKRYPARIDPAVVEAGFSLSVPGQVSDVIAGQNGFYAVKLLERRKAAPVPLEQIEPALRNSLLHSKQEQILEDFQSQLRKGLPVEVHAGRLNAIKAAAPGEPPPPPSNP